MEGTAPVLCRNLCRISPLLLLDSSDIFCNSPTRRGGPIPFHSLFYSPYNDMTVPAANSLPLILHGPLHSLRNTIGRKKVTIRGSCSFNPQKGMPTIMVNNRSASFPVCILHNNIIKWGTMIICVLYGLLIRASNSKSKSVYIDAG